MKTRYVLIGLVLLAFVLRAYPLQSYAGWDESIYLQHAEHIDNGRDNYLEWELRAPLVSVVLAGVFQMWHSIFAAQLLVNFLASLVLIPLYYLGKELFDAWTGTITGLIAAVHPVFVQNGHLILTDSVVATFLAAALWLAWVGRWWRCCLAGVLAGLAVLTKFTALAPAGVLGLFLVWRWKFRWVLAYGAGLAVSVVPYLWWSLHRWGNPVHPFLRSMEVASRAGHHTLSWWMVVSPFTVGLLLVWLVEVDWEYVALAVVWCVTMFAGIFRVHLEARYLIPVVVPLLPLAGAGLVTASRRFAWRYRDAVLVGLVLLLSYPAFTQFQYSPVVAWKSSAVDAAQAADRLNASRLYVTSEYPVYGYYSDANITVVDGPRFAEMYPQILREDGYLTVYRNATRPPTVSWAAKKPRLSRAYSNEDIVLYRYEYTYY